MASRDGKTLVDTPFGERWISTATVNNNAAVRQQAESQPANAVPAAGPSYDYAGQLQAQQYSAWQTAQAQKAAEAARAKAVADAQSKAFAEAEAKKAADAEANLKAQQASGSSAQSSSTNPQAAAAKLTSTSVSTATPFKTALQTASRSGNAFYNFSRNFGGR